MSLGDLSQEELVRAEASADRLLALHERLEILDRELAVKLSAFLAGVHALEDRRQNECDAGSALPPHGPDPSARPGTGSGDQPPAALRHRRG